MSSAQDYVVFEQPLTERVRIFLRLEHLFGQLAHHRADQSEVGARSTLHTLLDVLAILSRSDLKTDILKELSEQQAVLTRLAQRPGVDPAALQTVLGRLNHAVSALQQLTTQFASNLLRETDFLTTVANRYAMPGGTCGFDIPVLHYWLSQPRPQVERDLDAWCAGLLPFREAIALYLQLLRDSRDPEPETALRGMFIHNPQLICHLLRVHVPTAVSAFPEISASRHRFSIRYMSQTDINGRSHQLTVDVPFLLQCCAL